MIKTFDNKINIVGDDLKESIQINGKLSIASSIFSIYGYESLKKELNSIDKLRFIFTDPTFIKTDENNKDRKLFEINSSNRKKAISGSGFEINLKNELKGRTIAKECKAWCDKKVKFKTNRPNNTISSMLILDNNEDDKSIYLNINEFSSAGLGYKKDNTVLKLELPSSNSSAKAIEKENISIELNNKYVSYKGNKLNFVALQKKLELVKNKQQSVMINIDKDVPYNKVVQLLDILQLNNLNNIAFVTKKN